MFYILQDLWEALGQYHYFTACAKELILQKGCKKQLHLTKDRTAKDPEHS